MDTKQKLALALGASIAYSVLVTRKIVKLAKVNNALVGQIKEEQGLVQVAHNIIFSQIVKNLDL